MDWKKGLLGLNLESGFRIQETGNRKQEAGFRIQDSGNWNQESGIRNQETESLYKFLFSASWA